MWIFTCVKRDSYLLVGFVVGKRTLETCRKMLNKVYERLQLPSPSNPVVFFSDGHEDYLTVLPELYAIPCMKYGQLIKTIEKGRMVKKTKRVKFGDLDPNDIETTNVENMNSILRERIGRLVRKTKCHSKKKSRLENAFEFFNFHWNCMDPLPSGATPCMLEGLTGHPWSWDDFLLFHYAL